MNNVNILHSYNIKLKYCSDIVHIFCDFLYLYTLHKIVIEWANMYLYMYKHKYDY